MTEHACDSTEPVRVLLLEDDPDDAALLQGTLRGCGLPIRFDLVGDEAHFLAAIEQEPPDLVLADYRLRGYTGTEALRAFRARGFSQPFILISGVLADELAAECWQLGASDYVLKDRMARLPQAVHRVLAEYRLRAEHARAQLDLQRSYREYQLLFQSNPQPSLVLDSPMQGIVAANQAACRLYGYSEEEFLRLHTSDLHGEDAASSPAAEGAEGTEFGAVRHRHKSGSVLWVEPHSSAITFQGRPAHLLLIRDITERRALEEQLRQAQKMEAIGRLAGGIAHDFNNLLMVMRGFAELLESALPAGAQRRHAEQILSAADRAARLVGQLLAFGRKQVLSPRTLNLNECLAEVGKLLPRVLGEDIEILLRPGDELQSVKLDPLQIEQVIMNLAINARDAMPAGGKLVVETHNVTADAAFCRRHAAAGPGPYVVLTVSDTGCGMDEQTQSHVFEPFFTTKGPGRGTGLGLATVYGIVKQSGGFVWVSSELGHGTTFKLYFPAAAGESEPLARPREEARAARGDETVLVVEDENGVREAMTEFLTRCGYTVLAAPNGKDALELARRFRGAIALLVTDVVMPGMNGRELARRFVSERPESRVLFNSGYSGSSMAEQLAWDPGTAFLEKPFNWQAFSRKVREVLEAGAGHETPVAPSGAVLVH